MAHFRLTVVDAATGTSSELRVEAGSSAAARQLATRHGALVVACAEQAPAGTVAPQALRGLAAAELALWCQELRTLLQSGMTVVEALDTLRAQSVEPGRKALHDALCGSLQEGRALSQAMADTGAFPLVLVAGIKAGERTSNLTEALDEYLRFHALLDGLKKKIVSSAVYPAMVTAVGLLVCVFLLVFVIPRFASMYADRQADIGIATRALLGASTLLTEHSTLLAGLLTIAAAAMAHAWRRGRVRRVAEHLAETIPALRRLLLDFQLAKLFQALALMVRGGYPLSQALEHCAQLQLGVQLQERTRRTQALLLQGRSIAMSLQDCGLTDETSVRLLSVGERTGQFDRILQAIAQRHASRFGLSIERLTRVVEPAMLLAVSLLVGGIVVLMYMPVFDIAGSIQ